MVKFLVTHILPTLLNVWETKRIITAGESEGEGGPLFRLVVEISNFLVVANAATDSLVPRPLPLPSPPPHSAPSPRCTASSGGR